MSDELEAPVVPALPPVQEEAPSSEPREENAVLQDEQIEQVLDDMVNNADIGLSDRDTMKMILYAFKVGTNPDRIAEATGLNRDFVRKRAKILRENGIFVGEPMKRGAVAISDQVTDERTMMVELMLILMCAEGIVKKTGPVRAK
jgi:predicted transcriptional regulator